DRTVTGVQTCALPILEVHRASAAGFFHLTGPGIRDRVPRSSGATSSDDVALALYTSGTTARPKIVPLTHRNLITSAANVGRALQIGRASGRGRVHLAR